MFLTTNFVPEPELQSDVYLAGAQAGLEPVVVDQSRLADHLDKPEGQYLRRKFLRIEADSLSKDLLAELCRKSAERHAQRFLSGEIPVRIERETDRAVRVALRNPATTLLCLVADAGFGKSTTAQFILTEQLDAGGYGLWIPESELVNAISMDDAINRVLRSLHPALSFETASAWRTICGGTRLLLVSTILILSLIVRLYFASYRGGQRRADRNQLPLRPQGFVALCPVWTHVWEATRDPNKKQHWLSAVFLGPMQQRKLSQSFKDWRWRADESYP